MAQNRIEAQRNMRLKDMRKQESLRIKNENEEQKSLILQQRRSENHDRSKTKMKHKEIHG